MIVILDLDGDSGLYDPITHEKYVSNFGIYVLNIIDKKAFIDNLLSNKYWLSEKVYGTFLNFIEYDIEQDLINLEDGNYDFGNYNIKIYSNIVDIKD